MRNWRASRNVPNAAATSLRNAITARECQKGNTYAGRLNGDRIADCAFAKKGRPATMYGFHSGMCGSAERVCSRNGWNTRTESRSAGFEPNVAMPPGVAEL